jgi:diguanylate cyclase (GGDEF)-like protein
MDFIALESRLPALSAAAAADLPAPQRLAALTELAWHLRQRKTAQALQHCDEADALLAADAALAAASPGLAQRLRLVRGEAALLLGDAAAADAHARAALQALQSLGDAAGAADAHWLLASAAAERGDAAARDGALAACGEQARAAGDEARAVIADAAIARWAVMRDLPAAVERWQARLSDERLLALPGAATWVHDFLGGVAFGHGDFARATLHRIRSHEDALATGQLQRAIVALINAGACFGNLHDYETALLWTERALRTARKVGWPASVAGTLLQVGELLRLLGRLDAAHEVLSEAAASGALPLTSRNHAVMLQYLGEVQLQRHQTLPALQLFEELERRAAELDHADLLVVARRCRANALAELGRFDEAVVTARAGLQQSQAQGNLGEHIEGLVSLAEILAARAAQGLPAGADSARACLERALQIAETIEGYQVPGHVLDALARETARTGDGMRAYELAVRAARAREQINSAAAMGRAIALQVMQETERARANAERHRQTALAEAQRAASLQQTNDVLARLSVIGREITAHLQPEAIFRALDAHVHGLLDATHFSLYLYQPGLDKLVCAFGRENGQPLPRFEIDPSNPTSNVARCARERCEIHRDRLPGGPNPNHIPGTLSSASALFAPLAVGERLLGVMSIQSPKEQAYGERELLIFRNLCAFGAIALDNAGAYRQVQATLATVREMQAELEQKNVELERAHQEQREASLTDPLTGLRNRRFLLQHVEVEAALAVRHHSGRAADGECPIRDIVFFLIDLDHFKQVNDQYGHAAGDQVLVQMSERLRATARETDYVVRWGGEEFLLVARSTSREHAARLAERLCAMVADRPFELGDGQTLQRTCSVGFAAFPYLPHQPEQIGWAEVVELADQALYLAKQAGRNTWAGFSSPPSANADGLYRRLCEDRDDALAQGLLRIERPADRRAPGA